MLLYRQFPPRAEHGATRRVPAFLVLAGLSGALMWWTQNVRYFPEAMPREMPALQMLLLQGLGLTLGAAAFALAGETLTLGVVFGLMTSALGWCASRWPQLARALELNGCLFLGPFLAALLPAALALSSWAIASALLDEELRPNARRWILLVIALWAVPTFLTETALTQWWGFGPRSLAEAAGVPTNEDSEQVEVVWLSPLRERSTSRERFRMAAAGVDLSPESLTKLEDFLQRTGYRGVFVDEALEDVRRGWRLWWDADRALDAAMISVPGRVHPDYRRALDLIKAGPLTASRYAKLEQLAAAADESSAGFESVNQSQYIFEGFAAAYARFGDEAKARHWIGRVFKILLLAERKMEVAALEDFREGRVEGTVTIAGRPARSTMVGLFSVWKTTRSVAAVPLLSAAAFPDDDGRYVFTDLGPGKYQLALLGKAEDLRGRVAGSPGIFELGYEKPELRLPPIEIVRDAASVPEVFSPLGLPAPPEPVIPERPMDPGLRWQKR